MGRIVVLLGARGFACDLDKPELLPSGADAKPLDGSDYRHVDGDLQQPIRVTVDPEFYELHSDSVEFWTPGSPSFPQLDGLHLGNAI